MPSSKRRLPGLLTLREAASRLGVADSLLVDLVYEHPPIIDVALMGRAPRVEARQIAALHERLVARVMELIARRPVLLGTALGIARRATAVESGVGHQTQLRAIIAHEARELGRNAASRRPGDPAAAQADWAAMAAAGGSAVAGATTRSAVAPALVSSGLPLAASAP